MMIKPIATAAVLALSLGLGGCGSSTETTIQATETQGKQLMDLKEAYDNGVISEKEYDKARKRILKQ